jgi:1-phosphofructokinase family hexose kinase
MLLTVTPNLCVERTVRLEEFAVGRVHRVPPANIRVNAGGKGINAARVAARMGCRTRALAWVHREQRAWFEAQLGREGVPHELVETDAPTRTCVNIVDGRGGKTEIVEAGHPLTVKDGTRMLEKVDASLPEAKLLAVCGSYPPARSTPSSVLLGAGAPPVPFDAHLTLLAQLAARYQTPILIDGKGVPFEMALRAGVPVWCIKPNLDEAAQLLHRAIASEADERRALRALRRLGPDVVLLSCGARGLYVATREGEWKLETPRVNEGSPVGSGDAMVGAFGARWLECGDVLDAARWGVAAGAANAAQEYSAFCTRAEIEAALPGVAVRPL